MAKKPIKPVAAPDQLQVPPAVLEKLQKAHAGVMGAKIILADRWLAVREAENALIEFKAAFEATLQGFTQRYGIDINDPSKGKWHFDLQAGTIKKVE